MCPIQQFAVVLGDGMTAPDALVEPCMTFRWTVVQVGDLDRGRLLSCPTTAPLAALTSGTPAQRRATLAAAAAAISQVEPPRRDVLLGAAAALASIVLPEHDIAAALGGWQP